MSRIICMTGTYPIYDKYGIKYDTEFVVSHGIDESTNRIIILPSIPPIELGAKYDTVLQEWIIEE